MASSKLHQKNFMPKGKNSGEQRRSRLTMDRGLYLKKFVRLVL